MVEPVAETPEKLLSREKKKNKKLEERFTQLVKEKNQLQKQIDQQKQLILTNEETSEQVELEMTQLESLFCVQLGASEIRRPDDGKFDLEKLTSLLQKLKEA